jgi:hypothetical protein
VSPGRAVLISTLVLSVGCGPSSGKSSPESYHVEAREIEVLGPEFRFTRVRDMVVTEDAVWVLDAAPPFLTRLSRADDEVTQFGRLGQGPGEFINPWSIQPTSVVSEPGIQVWDLGNARVYGFDTRGDLLHSKELSREHGVRVRGDLPEVSFVDPFRVRRTDAGFLSAYFPRRVDSSFEIATGSLRTVDQQLHPGPELAQFPDHVLQAESSLREWASLPLWDACDGGVVLWSPISSEVLWMDQTGQVEGGTTVEETPRPITPEDIEIYLQRMWRLELGPGFRNVDFDFPRLATEYRHLFPPDQPPVTDIRCESMEVVWLRLFDTTHDPLGRSQSWKKVSKDGSSGRITFPASFVPRVFSPQAVWGLTEGPDGSQRLGRWSGFTASDGLSQSTTSD